MRARERAEAAETGQPEASPSPELIVSTVIARASHSAEAEVWGRASTGATETISSPSTTKVADSPPRSPRRIMPSTFSSEPEAAWWTMKLSISAPSREE